MFCNIPSEKVPIQRDRLIDHLTHHGLARANELARSGVSATTIARSLAKGDIVRVGRGLYQLADAELDIHGTLAEVSKLAPKGVICLVSALAFHDLTDQIPRRTWIAIGTSDWAPKIRQSARYGFANAISLQKRKPIKFAVSTCRFIRLPNRLQTLSAIRNSLIGP